MSTEEIRTGPRSLGQSSQCRREESLTSEGHTADLLILAGHHALHVGIVGGHLGIIDGAKPSATRIKNDQIARVGPEAVAGLDGRR